MSRRRCCCAGTGTLTPSCVVFQDSFARADNQDVGAADWLESAGTAGPFRVDGGKLAVTAADGETLECLHTIPEDTGTADSDHYLVYVSVEFGDAQDGDSFSMYVGDLAGRVELQRMSANRGQLRLYDGDACKGSHNVTLYPSTPLTVCVEGSMVHATFGAGNILSLPLAVVSSVVHLSATCEGTVRVSSFTLSKHQYDDAACPACRNEDCVWFDDGGFPAGALSPIDYTATQGAGTAASEDFYYSNNAIRCDADGTLQVAVVSPRGILGRVYFYCLHAGNVGANVDFYYDADSTCFIRFTKTSAASCTVTSFCGEVQYGPSFVRSTLAAGVMLCWDGTTLFGGPHFSFAEAPTDFRPKVEVSGLTSGYIALDRISAQKDGGDVVPEKTCDTCDPPLCVSCETGTYRTDLTLTISGLTMRDTMCSCAGTGTYPLTVPYGTECPGTVTIPMLANTGAFPDSCSWAGSSEAVIPAYHISYGWHDVCLTATAQITPVTGGYLLSVEINAQLGSSIGETPAVAWVQFQETFVGDPPSCEEFGDVPFSDGYQTDGCSGIYTTYLLCEFVTPQTCPRDPAPIHGTTALTITLSP